MNVEEEDETVEYSFVGIMLDKLVKFPVAGEFVL